MTEYRDWLQSLKTGDMVLINIEDAGQHRKEVVDRLTVTQIITKHGYRFRKSDGQLVGYNLRLSLVQPTPELLTEIQDAEDRENAIRTIAKFKGSRWDGVSTERLKAITDILNGDAMTINKGECWTLLVGTPADVCYEDVNSRISAFAKSKINNKGES
jgi:hypothetical protein